MMWSISLQRVVEERHYDVKGVDDLQDSSVSRRKVIRPTGLVLGMEPGEPRVRYASIRGRQVRGDGRLADMQMVVAGLDRGDATPPEWLNDFLKVEGLEWVARQGGV